MMNVSTAVQQTSKQLMCSTVVRDVLKNTNILAGTAYEDYLCACCFSPCAACQASASFGGDITSASVLQSTVTNKMGDLTNYANAASLFTPSGYNGLTFSNMWSEASLYFVKVCLSECGIDYTDIDGSTARSYEYSPDPDDPFAAVWQLLKDNGAVPQEIKSAISSFSFTAFPLSTCPYPAKYCVPFPGVQYAEVANSGYCTFKIATDVADAVGTSAASAFESLGLANMKDAAVQNFGEWWGDFEKSIDAFVLVFVCSFIMGMIFLVILRFTVGVCVWLSIFLVLVILLLGGGLCMVRSTQCAGTSFFDSGQQQTVAVVVAGQTTVTNAITGTQASEELTGDHDSGYIGIQSRSRSGKTCQRWTQQDPHSHDYALSAYPDILGDHNYCRNPFSANDRNIATTIWCFTTDTETRWELCTPVGIIQPECPDGYAVNSETGRKVLEISSWVLWVLAIIWVLLICCAFNRIRLAIAMNKVGVMYMGQTPFILLVPIVQGIVAFLWCLLWALSAAFVLSQVGASTTPTGHYASYAEAYGTADNKGACENDWPNSEPLVWRDGEDCDGTKCWRCAPPRYLLDWKFAVSFFTFLWNNALLIALGQCIIAGSVGVWFFTSNDQKGKAASIKRSVRNAFRYHLGSLAFGAFLIALVQFIRYLMQYLERQAAHKENRITRIIRRVLVCCLWCFEKILKFINKNAYIQIALMGTNFCTSAKAAFHLILRNFVRFGVVATLGLIIHGIGYVVITVSTTIIGYFILQFLHPDLSVVIPLCIYAGLGYVVGALYLNVFGLAVDASLQCMIAAEEMDHDGDFVPAPLKSLLPPKKTAFAGVLPDEEEKQDKSSWAWQREN